MHLLFEPEPATLPKLFMHGSPADMNPSNTRMPSMSLTSGGTNRNTACLRGDGAGH